MACLTWGRGFAAQGAPARDFDQSMSPGAEEAAHMVLGQTPAAAPAA